MPHALSSYVPNLLLERLASASPLAAPEARRTPAAILLSDIQGFTTLVESFSGTGREGLEELTWILNTYFTDLVELVYGHGGDVLYIAGDAFLCAWPATSNEGLVDATLRAARTGLAIQAAVHDRPCGPDRTLRTRIGVGAGELAIAFAGGHRKRWELIVSGPPLREAVDAEQRADAGRVVLSPGAFELIERQCDGILLYEGSAALESLGDAPETPPVQLRPALADAELRLRPYLPAAVLERQLVAQAEWLAEQRTVTVLLADLPELGDASAERLARTHVGIRTFQEVVHRYEGTVKVDVDNKGILLLAVFGLPPLAHEDDAARAVQAAGTLKSALESHGVSCGIGIATGRGFCGSFGSELRREFMLRGDAINLAARLMERTGTEILCDQETSRAARGRIRFEERSTVSVKGRSGPLRVFRPGGRREAEAPASSSVIGRVAERRILGEQLAALRAGGRGGTILVEGEAGMGKSRLVSDASTLAEGLGVRVLTAAADAIERSTAYYPWRRVFVELFDLKGDVDATLVRDRVLHKLVRDPSVERLLPLLSSVLPVRIPDNELTEEMTGDVRADNTRQLLARIVRAVASESPTLLVVEDAHWLDSNSWAVLVEVVRSVQPLLTLIAMRPGMESQGPEGDPLLQLPDLDRLRLEGLAEEETAALIRQRVGVEEIPVELSSFVQERVAGHPFYCEELVQSMIESETIRIVDGSCEIGDLSALNLPSTVEGVIISRLDRLTGGQQLCLKVASVIGRTFRTRTVTETVPADSERERVPRHLAVLTEQSLTVPDTSAVESTYLFKHVLTRDVTYDLMPQIVRQPLHRAVAEWYERNFSEDLSPYYALLAYHWGRAREQTRTIEYLEKAGQQALRGGAFQEALLFFSQALELSDGSSIEPQRRALWQKGLGTAQYFLGDLQKSRAHLETAVGLLDRPIPTGTAAAARAAAGATFEQALHRALPSRFLGRRSELKTVLDEVVDCYKILGQIYYLDGEPALPVIYLTLRGLNVGELAGASSGLARILSNTATLSSLLGATGWADHYATRAIDMAQQEGQYAAAAYVRCILALMHAQRGDWASAKQAIDEAMERIQELGDYNLEPEAWVVRSTVHICEGDFTAAPVAWRRARELAERNNNPQILCWSLLDEVDTLLGRGETDAAARVLDVALAIPTREADRSSTIDKQHALAVTRLRQGRWQEAVDAADVVVDMVSRRQPTGYFWVDFCASAVETYLSVLEHGGSFSESNRRSLTVRIDRGCKLLGRLSRNFWNVRPRAHLLTGLRHWHRGKPARAFREWKRARTLAAQMNMPFEEARALLEIGRHDGGPGAKEGLARASATFERLGADHYRGLADQARSGRMRD